MAVIRGNNKKNSLVGTSLSDSIFGLGDNDVLTGFGGNDKLYGDAGNDRLVAGEGNDFLDGGADNDTMFGDNGNDNMRGGTGSDTMFGGTGNDTMAGGTGADQLNGGAGTDTLTYAAETNAVSIFLDNSTLASGAATGDRFSSFEIVIGSRFGDVISGNSVANTLIGGTGDDILFGRGGLDQLLGGDGDDFFLPGADTSADVINGGDGNDTVSYQDATQRVGVALEGNLTDFGADNDIYISIENVVGSNFDDAIQVAFGGAALGLDGSDSLEGSRTVGFANQSTEFLTGGNGADLFLLHLGTGADALIDFNVGEGDRIAFRSAEFAATPTVLNLNGQVASNSGGPQFIYERLTDVLYYDADGQAGTLGPVAIAYLPDLGAGFNFTINDHFAIFL